VAVQRFRSFEEARRALWLDGDDPRLLVRMKRIAAMGGAPRAVRRGITRLRTLAEAKASKGAAWQVRPDL
jgi:hypothetical protein